MRSNNSNCSIIITKDSFTILVEKEIEMTPQYKCHFTDYWLKKTKILFKNNISMKTLLILILSSFIISCNTENSNHIKKERQIELISEPDINLQLAFQKMQVDFSLIKNKKAIRYIVIDKNQKPKRIRLEDEVDDHETQYFIYKDSSNIVKAIIEVPFSQSGDWFLEVIYYFDKEAQLFAFQKQLNTFHHAETCGDDEALHIRTIEYYDKGNSIKMIKTLQNSKGKEFKENSCSYQDIEMPIFKNLIEWSISSKIDFE